MYFRAGLPQAARGMAGGARGGIPAYDVTAAVALPQRIEPQSFDYA